MLAIEFEADIKDGVIKIPEKYKGKLAKHIKVIALMDEVPEKEMLVQYSDEYIEKHWQEIVVTSNMGDNFEKSDLLKEQRAAFLLEKYQ